MKKKTDTPTTPPTSPITYLPLPNGGLVASGKRVSPRELAARTKPNPASSEWQDLGWHYYDAVGEIKYAINLKANTIGRVETFPAKYETKNSQPIPLTSLDSLSPADQLALDTYNRISDYQRILRDISIHYSVPGECYLVGTPATPTEPETWTVYSKDQIRVEGAEGKEKVYIKNGAMDTKGTLLPTDSYYAALWLEHPRWKNTPDSPLRGILGSAEMVLILEDTVRAIARSRAVAAGILRVPNELIPNTPVDPLTEPADDNSTPEPPPFLTALLNAMTAPLATQGDAAQVAPMIVHGPAEYLDKLNHFSMERPFDEQLDVQMTRALRRLAQGLDMPVEIVLGVEGLNHWTAWMVDESMIHVHVEPSVQKILTALTESFYLPQLRAAFEEADITDSVYQYTLHYDTSNLTIHPNKTRDMLTAYEADLASGRATREVLGLKEEDAPDKIEILLKLLKRVAIDPNAGIQLINELFGLNLTLPSETPDQFNRGMRQGRLADDPGDGNTVKIPDSRQSNGAGAAGRNDGQNSRITGSTYRPQTATSFLTAQIIGATEQAISTASDRIGGRIRGAARKDKHIAASISATPNCDVACVLGPTIASAYNYPAADEIAGFLAPLQSHLRTITDTPSHAIDTYLDHVASHLMEQLYRPSTQRAQFPVSRIHELLESVAQTVTIS